MTVVIGIKKDGIVYMGSDSCASTSTYVDKVPCNEHGKISVMPNGVIFGLSGIANTKTFLNMNKKIFDFANDGLTREGIVNHFIPKIRKLFSMNNLIWDGESPVCMLMAKDDKLFNITDDWRVLSVKSYAAIGCGKGAAYSALFKNNTNPEEDIINACKKAAEVSKGVEGPYVLINTKDRIYKEII